MTGFDKATKTLDKLWPGLMAGDRKAIHEARKLTRKAQAQLRVAGAPKRTKRAWRELRQAVAPVRDRDAAGAHLVEALRELGAPEADLRAFQAAWGEARARVFSGVKFPEPPPAIERPKGWKARVREALESDAGELRREAERVLGGGRVEEWHEWRKHLKRYRYTLELLDKAPDALLDVLDALGRMQDAQVMQDLLKGEDWLPNYREALLAHEVRAQEEAQARVQELWPALREHLRAQAGKEDRKGG